MTHMTPKDFAPHLLGVLATFTEYEANISVPMNETFTLVCESMGIEESHGGDTGSGYKFTHRQIGLAFRQHIRGKGLGEQAKKGHWMLTQEGVDRARENAGEVAPPIPTVPEPTPVLVAARAEATAEALNEDDGAEVLQLPVVGSNLKHPYSDDPYIRLLAIEATPCYGSWSARSDTCSKECPLVADCVLQVGARKAEMAAVLDAEEAAVLDAEKAQKEEAAKKGLSVEELILKMDEEAAQNSQRGKFKPTQGQDFAGGNASRESVCLQCGETIQKGIPIRWCENEGIFHVDCFDDSNP